jgi:hypothetical protein
MAKLFQKQDDLLSASGIVPVYYWLARNTDPQHTESIRPFLVGFERKRKQNDRRAEEQSTGVKRELLEYSKTRRSPNDQRSLAWLYDVLNRRFQRFLRK